MLSAYNLYHEPAGRFIADFVGQGVFIRGTLMAPDTVETELGIIKGNRAYSWPRGSMVDVLLRPDDIQPDSKSGVSAGVMTKASKGAETLYSLRLPTASTVLSMLPSHLDQALGDRRRIRVNAGHLIAFPA